MVAAFLGGEDLIAQTDLVAVVDVGRAGHGQQEAVGQPPLPVGEIVG